MGAGLSSSQRTYLGMINRALAMHPKWAYLDPAWILSIMKIESGYNPTVINATGRQDGLMQVEPPTAQDMARLYGVPEAPQTSPMIAILSGTAYLDHCSRSLIKALNTTSLPLWSVAKAYNGGWGNLVPGAIPSARWLAAVARYLLKFQAALPIVELQMEATAMLADQVSFAPRSVVRAAPQSVAPI
jgi:soluble lytic murein transglycosylase-like protein